MGRRANDFMIGLVVIVAVAALLALTLKVNKFSFSKGGYDPIE